ncbi:MULTISPECIES: hypothetical protein [Legionella]|uniref:hypothetical protein n=1 Tax=Legionella TaxID=445 RepID=UPI00095DC3E2|nr:MULTISPECIES: hypothetical protein [Legionella]MBN9226067.1 hypothetical protein [Legionella steelei]OJW16611.1 MAG: hypothetical protein BGO44_00850 [Legionella sp. 39-23]
MPKGKGSSAQATQLAKSFLDGLRKNKEAYDLVDMGVNPYRFLKNTVAPQVLAPIAEDDAEEKAGVSGPGL